MLALGWLVALLGNAVLNPLLKLVFARSRPVHDPSLAQAATGFSFPSGHSSGAMVAYGMLLYVLLRVLPARWHPAAAMLAAALIVTTACSRVFLRVHFASDVAAGLLLGLSWLAVCVVSLEFARQAAAQHPTLMPALAPADRFGSRQEVCSKWCLGRRSNSEVGPAVRKEKCQGPPTGQHACSKGSRAKSRHPRAAGYRQPAWRLRRSCPGISIVAPDSSCWQSRPDGRDRRTPWDS